MIMGTRRVDYEMGVATVTDGQDIVMECEGLIGRITTEELQDALYRNPDFYVILGYRRSENEDGHVKSEWELVRGLCPMTDDELSVSCE